MTAQTSPLLAALDAIEETARRATPGPWKRYVRDDRRWALVAEATGDERRDAARCADDDTAAHIALHDPAFTLRLVEGLREVVDVHGGGPVVVEEDTGLDDENGNRIYACGGCGDVAPCRTLRALTRALVGEEEGTTG